MIRTDQTCENCIFFKRSHSFDRKEKGTGKCLYDAPTLIGESLDGEWPIVYDTESCGRIWVIGQDKPLFHV